MHGGNLYRAIVYSLMNSGQSLHDLKNNMQNINIKEIMDKLKIDIKIENRESVIYAAGILIEEEKLQSKDSSMAVSIVGGIADNSKLFAFAKELIEQYKQEHTVIISRESPNGNLSRS